MPRPETTGACGLCLQTRTLRRSHFLPASLYRLARLAAQGKSRHPVAITAEGRMQTSRQAQEFLLCEECERRFNQNGENWTLRNCYRGRGVFRLRDHLRELSPLPVATGEEVYAGGQHPEINLGQLVYFCSSVFWRAAVRDWTVAEKRYEAINLGTPYHEHVRRFLLGTEGFPDNCYVCLFVSKLTRPVLAFNFPQTSRVELARCHVLHIPGLTFFLTIGRIVPDFVIEYCLVHSPHRGPIVVSLDGDQRVQREILRLMGKVETSWGAFPVIDGVEPTQP
jgi:hypothetical protein